MTTPAEIRQLHYDHHSPEFAAERHRIVADLRENRLSFSDAHGGFYAVARHEDVRLVGLSPGIFSSERDHSNPLKLGVQIPPSANVGLPIIPAEADAPYHTAYRRALAPFFTMKTVDAWEQRLRHWTTICLDEVIETGRIDIVEDLTGPVAFLFFFEMLGLPVELWARWRDPIHTIQTNPPGTEAWIAAQAANDRNNEELLALVEQRRREPQDDLISHLGKAKGPGGELFSVREVAALALLVLFGAVDSVGSLVSQSLRYLAQDPTERERLREDPARLPLAIEEFLRYFSPGSTMGRTVAQETELAGAPLHPGDRIQLSLIGANRDPDVFVDPDKLILDRAPNPHLAFGAGVHKCIGLQFARLEGLVFIEQVLVRMADYTVIEEEVVPMPTVGLFSGYWSMPLRFTPGNRLQGERRPSAVAGDLESSTAH
jgi:cytochrome P450